MFRLLIFTSTREHCTGETLFSLFYRVHTSLQKEKRGKKRSASKKIYFCSQQWLYTFHALHLVHMRVIISLTILTPKKKNVRVLIIKKKKKGREKKKEKRSWILTNNKNSSARFKNNKHYDSRISFITRYIHHGGIKSSRLKHRAAKWRIREIERQKVELHDRNRRCTVLHSQTINRSNYM